RSGIVDYEIRYFGRTFAGLCDFDEFRYQRRRDRRRGTRAGSIAIWCAHEAIADAGFQWSAGDEETETPWNNGLPPRDRLGVFIGITEHGNVETENEVYNVSQFDYDCKYWTHHHNPRTVANNPAGEVTINMGITGAHYTIGAACAGGNAGLIQGAQQLLLGECDLAIAGGVSESPGTFGIFAAFASQNALAHGGEAARASRPFDLDRNGIVVSEGGCLYTLERLSDAKARGAKIYGEITGWAINSDARDPVLPFAPRQAACIRQAIRKADLRPDQIDLVSTHATATPSGDIQEAVAIRSVFGDDPHVYVNNTKSFIGHAMGASGALELAGNLPSFEDGVVHPTINLDRPDPQCALAGLVAGTPRSTDGIGTILNMSFGMLGINSVTVVKRV
ncbi:MAG: beta-ketoacyl-[acyl-carrier-protein] synthase family protein, partial [Planctomycetia bacterium]|nr:beta-ketoacyl-[acyl-carrier-protein] synthase family protein [Planctomycetia bacterium]